MPRTDENGRSLESLLTYLLDGVNASDISAALGVSHATYYRRKREDSYPNAEELRIIADHFDLNPVDLMVRFGLVSADDVAGVTTGVTRSPLATAKAKTRRKFITPRVDLAGPSL
jgi:transcriptional regulator with XRE-family HTH domain